MRSFVAGSPGDPPGEEIAGASLPELEEADERLLLVRCGDE
jgi:hypothetical protein